MYIDKCKRFEKIQSIWNEENIRKLTAILIEHQGQAQDVFLSGARNQLKYQVVGEKGRKKTEYYSEKQIIAKSREIARQASKKNYQLSVPRKATKTAIIQDWDELFVSAGLKKKKKA